MEATSEVQVRLNHIVGSELVWSRNERVVHYRSWDAATERPSGEGDPGERTMVCGDCAAVATFRLWTAERTRRRRQLLGGLAIVVWLVLPVLIVLAVTGTVGRLGLIAVPVVVGLAFGLSAAHASEQGLRAVKVTGPDGSRARRHRVRILDPAGFMPPHP